MSIGQAVFLRPVNDPRLSALPDDRTLQREDDEETVLDLKNDYAPFDNRGAQAYEKACKKLGVVPSSQYIRALTMADTANLGHYGLGARGTMAICIPLVINIHITTLDLSHNHLGRKGVEYVRKMMCENDTITTLNLSHNELGREGAMEVGYLIKFNSTLKNLDISGNGFSDDEADLLLRAIEENGALRTVNLSHNNFCENSGKCFKRLLTENSLLEELDLSWNKLRRSCAKAIAEGLKENRGLVKLDLSWNGFEDGGSIALGEALSENNTLEELNVTCNRVGPEGFLKLCRAFQFNETLTSLKIAQNFITEETMSLALIFFKNVANLALEKIDITGTVLSSGFETKVQEVTSVHENFSCIHGYQNTHGTHKRDREEIIRGILNTICDHLKTTNTSITELFVDIDTDGSMSVSRAEFKQGLKNALIPITPFQLDELIRYLDKDGDGEIDFSELVFMK